VKDQKSFYQEVGRRIQEARKRRKPRLTQEGLSQLVSLTRTSITNVEKGRQKILLHTLIDIAEALQVQVEALIPQSATKVPNLDDALKHRPKSEKAWILSTVNAAQKGD
jgi:DNA-binding XRE family transcriptional regulator